MPKLPYMSMDDLIESLYHLRDELNEQEAYADMHDLVMHCRNHGIDMMCFCKDSECEANELHDSVTRLMHNVI